MTLDHVATARWNLAHARKALAGAKDQRERKLIRQNIAQIEAWLRERGAEVAS